MVQVTCDLLEDQPLDRIQVDEFLEMRHEVGIKRLTHPNMRESLGIPFLHVGKLIRFKLDEIKAWMLRCSAEMEAHGIEVPKDPRAQRRTLLEALVRLPA